MGVLYQQSLSMDLVTADRHGIETPLRRAPPVSRVYPANKVAGECYYKPMVNYIDSKELEWKDLELTEAVCQDIVSRPRVNLPCVGDIMVQEETIDSAPNLTRFLMEYGAKQAKQQHGQTVHCKHQYIRQNVSNRGKMASSETLNWPSDAARIRASYISKLSTMNRLERRSPYSPQVCLFSPSAIVLLHQYKHVNEFTK